AKKTVILGAVGSRVRLSAQRFIRHFGAAVAALTLRRKERACDVPRSTSSGSSSSTSTRRQCYLRADLQEQLRRAIPTSMSLTRARVSSAPPCKRAAHVASTAEPIERARRAIEHRLASAIPARPYTS